MEYAGSGTRGRGLQSEDFLDASTLIMVTFFKLRSGKMDYVRDAKVKVIMAATKCSFVRPSNAVQ
jgi:hypothetical protein